MPRGSEHVENASFQSLTFTANGFATSFFKLELIWQLSIQVKKKKVEHLLLNIGKASWSLRYKEENLSCGSFNASFLPFVIPAFLSINF